MTDKEKPKDGGKAQELWLLLAAGALTIGAGKARRLERLFRLTLAALMGLAAFAVVAFGVSAGLILSVLAPGAALMSGAMTAQGTALDGERSIQMIAIGLLSWAASAALMGICGWIRKKKGPQPISAKSQEAVGRARAGWARSQSQLWHESMARLEGGVFGALDRAWDPKGGWADLARFAAWALAAPLSAAALMTGVAPWMAARAALWPGFAARRWVEASRAQKKARPKLGFGRQSPLASDEESAEPSPEAMRTSLGERLWKGALSVAGFVWCAVSLPFLFSAAIILSATPQLMLVGGLAHAGDPNLDMQRVVELALAGALCWLMAPLSMRACAWIRGWGDPVVLSAQTQSAIQSLPAGWLRNQSQLWHESNARLDRSFWGSAEALWRPGTGALAAARFACWALAAPLLASVLIACVSPWLTARLSRWLGLRALAGLTGARKGLEALCGPAAPGEPERGMARLLARAPAGAARASKAWARKKTLEVAKAGEGTAMAARIQRAALDKEIRGAIPKGKTRPKPPPRL